MKRSVDTTSETAGAGRPRGNTRQTSKLVCMEGEGCCGRRIVLCAESEKNTFHELLKGQTWRGRKKCSLAFVGKLYLRVRKHLVLQPGTDRRLFITFTIVNTTAVMRFVSCSCQPGAEMLCSCSLVPGPPGIAALSCKNCRVVLSLQEGLKFA